MNDFQKQRAETFKNLHHGDGQLVLLNISNPLEALMMEQLGCKAVATASASVALLNGYADGEKIPFQMYGAILKRMASIVRIPVSADIESGFAGNENELCENIKTLIDSGVAGINLEDTDQSTGKLLAAEVQANRIVAIKKTAKQMGTDIFVNARTDMYLHPQLFETEAAKLAATITRAQLYLDAGADCIYPILMKQAAAIEKVVAALRSPINILATKDGLPLMELQRLGVKRVSVGPALLRASFASIKSIVEHCRENNALDTLYQAILPNNYLEQLIKDQAH